MTAYSLPACSHARANAEPTKPRPPRMKIMPTPQSQPDAVPTTVVVLLKPPNRLPDPHQKRRLTVQPQAPHLCRIKHLHHLPVRLGCIPSNGSLVPGLRPDHLREVLDGRPGSRGDVDRPGGLRLFDEVRDRGGDVAGVDEIPHRPPRTPHHDFLRCIPLGCEESPDQRGNDMCLLRPEIVVL